MSSVKFDKMWNNFPDKAKMKTACVNKQHDGQKPFSNYCAILLSECLLRSGVDLSRFDGKKCWSHSGKKHSLLAGDLASWLVGQPPPGFGNREKVLPGSFESILKGRTGVIYFKDYWQRGHESFNARSGDHIDLWKENEITSSSMLYRSIIEWLGFVSDLNKSREVWFWEVK